MIKDRPDIHRVLEELRSTLIFGALDRDSLIAVAQAVTRQEFVRGQFLTHEGDEPAGLYVVISGTVKRFKTLGRREQVLAFFGPGESFAEACLLDGCPEFATTLAIEAGAVYGLPREEFEPLLHAVPQLSRLLAEALAQRLRHFTQVIEDLGLRDSTERVASLIVRHDASGRLHMLTQADLAAALGTVREVVARALRELERLNAISLSHGRILVYDQPLLASIARLKQ
jgi:CRP/FNR family transcriptional regulator